MEEYVKEILFALVAIVVAGVSWAGKRLFEKHDNHETRLSDLESEDAVKATQLHTIAETQNRISEVVERHMVKEEERNEKHDLKFDDMKDDISEIKIMLGRYINE